ncbi:uncharacterized protein LOC113556041 isoform X2 [Rhopalosiphum maidis]|uniref:uncharacterized protein LOC113556041 isoform X2 n=1 Tax=Rhopalosiphum maidis TaxID=43146 RepID=UPI000EFF77A8|nr:uncharacterized protein LOC113556041 isoform X2 [Rhopalosiphum maidis]XP_026816558.1 uncharacterized protein LOC113556041 isoform X2 [Rhopalosiphum maidis]
MDSLISHVGKYQHPTLMDWRRSRILQAVRQITQVTLIHEFTFLTRGIVSTAYVANGLEDAENNTCYMQCTYGTTADHTRHAEHGFTFLTRGKVSTSYVNNGLEDVENNNAMYVYWLLNVISTKLIVV